MNDKLHKHRVYIQPATTVQSAQQRTTPPNRTTQTKRTVKKQSSLDAQSKPNSTGRQAMARHIKGTKLHTKKMSKPASLSTSSDYTRRKLTVKQHANKRQRMRKETQIDLAPIKGEQMMLSNHFLTASSK